MDARSKGKQQVMNDNEGENKTKGIKKNAKYLVNIILFLLLFTGIILIIFFSIFEIDGVAQYTNEFKKINSLKKRLNKVKNLYTKGRYIDVYNNSYIYSYLDIQKSILISSFEDLDYIISDETGYKDYLEHKGYRDDVNEEKKQEIIKKIENDIENEVQNEHVELERCYELNLYNDVSEIMNNSYVKGNYLPTSSLTFFKTSNEISSFRIIVKRNTIPDIYNYAKKLTASTKFNIIKTLFSAKLFRTCGDYKDSKNLCVSSIEKVLLKLFSLKHFLSNKSVYLDSGKYYYKSYSWSDLIAPDKLVDLIYYYHNFGGDMSKLKKKFDEFTKSLNEEGEKKFNEVIALKSEFFLKKQSKINKKNLKELNKIRNKIENKTGVLCDIYNYMMDLEELRKAYYITKLKIDAELIKNSEIKMEDLVNLGHELSKEYKELEELYPNNEVDEEDDSDNEEELELVEEEEEEDEEEDDDEDE